MRTLQNRLFGWVKRFVVYYWYLQRGLPGVAENLIRLYHLSRLPEDFCLVVAKRADRGTQY